MALSPPLAESLALAARVLAQVLAGASLNAALAPLQPGALRAAAQDLSYGALREYGVVDVALGMLLDKPLKDKLLRGLLLAALAELRSRPQAAHMIVDQAVDAAVRLRSARAKGLVNAVLRNSLRRSAEIELALGATETARYKHPQWWIEALRAAYPRDWKSILVASNLHPPMTLRVNARRLSPQSYLHKLAQSGLAARPMFGAAIRLVTPCRVEALPGFAEGEVSVQDAGAQCAAPLLDVRPGMRLLDACAAPGGKAAHLLELAQCDVTAVELLPQRAERIADNFARLGLSGRIIVGNCLAPQSFWDGVPYDRILLDVPCSASGVVRRHPDIKWLRRNSDIARFAATQGSMLESLWPLLAPDGKLLYATCSVFPEENAQQVSAFLVRHPAATRLALAGTPCAVIDDGQILPGEDSDGFFYALLQKT